MPDLKKLARLHRVRTLQLTLTQGEEARARETAAAEASLSRRIADLADGVAPAPDRAAGMSLAAAAHFRDRLHRSAETAANRVREADVVATRASEATKAARRDQNAVEKLIARGEAEAALRAIRALQEAPPARKIRHSSC